MSDYYYYGRFPSFAAPMQPLDTLLTAKRKNFFKAQKAYEQLQAYWKRIASRTQNNSKYQEKSGEAREVQRELGCSGEFKKGRQNI